MRPIKFRAWDKDEKRFMRVAEIRWDGSNRITLHDDATGMAHWRKLEDVELLQFTGLLDKNGKEIYEGDVVRLWCGSDDFSKRNKITATIVWAGEDRAEFIPEIHNKEIKVKGGSSNGEIVRMGQVHLWTGMHSCWSYLEVIGNIQKNPELLK